MQNTIDSLQDSSSEEETSPSTSPQYYYSINNNNPMFDDDGDETISFIYAEKPPASLSRLQKIIHYGLNISAPLATAIFVDVCTAPLMPAARTMITFIAPAAAYRLTGGARLLCESDISEVAAYLQETSKKNLALGMLWNTAGSLVPLAAMGYAAGQFADFIPKSPLTGLVLGAAGLIIHQTGFKALECVCSPAPSFKKCTEPHTLQRLGQYAIRFFDAMITTAGTVILINDQQLLTNAFAPLISVGLDLTQQGTRHLSRYPAPIEELAHQHQKSGDERSLPEENIHAELVIVTATDKVKAVTKVSLSTVLVVGAACAATYGFHQIRQLTDTEETMEPGYFMMECSALLAASWLVKGALSYTGNQLTRCVQSLFNPFHKLNPLTSSDYCPSFKGNRRLFGS